MADADLPDAAAPLDPPARRQLVVRRVLQFAVDLGVMTLLCLVPIAAMLFLVPRQPDGTMEFLAGLLGLCAVALSCLLIGVGYWVLLPGRARAGRLGGGGQTPGMRWFRLRVVDRTGRAVTRTQLAVRWVMLLVDGIAFGFVAVIAMLLSPRGQRLGDLMAGTVVVLEHHRRAQPRSAPHTPPRVR